MNPARLAELHRARAALQKRLAVVDEQIADELAGEASPEQPKPKRPPYVVPASVSDVDRRKGARALRARGFAVQGRVSR